jgi:hypothetical protein
MCQQQAYRVSIRILLSEQLWLLWVCRVEMRNNFIPEDDTNAIPYTVHFLSRSQRRVKRNPIHSPGLTQLKIRWLDFNQIWHEKILLKSSDVFQFELQSDSNKGKGHPMSRLCRQNRNGGTAPIHSQPRRSQRVGGQHYAPAALPPRKDIVPIVQEARWAPGPV